MSVLNKIRNTAFWTLDRVKKGAVRNHLSDIQRHFSQAEAQVSSTKLKNLLRHAVETTAFFEKMQGFGSLSDFPVINKNLIRENRAAFVSAKYQKENLLQFTTSGSTGTPFQFYQDRNKKARNTADTFYFSGLSGYNLGEKIYYLKIWSTSNKKSPLVSFMQNVEMVDVMLLDDAAIADLIGNWEKEKSDFAVIGYASAIEQVCHYLKRKGRGKIITRMTSAIAISETLTEFTKQTFTEYFNVPLISRYSNLENGILAQQCFDNTEEFHINTASYHIEILDMHADRPAPAGETGRIVVTDLYNYAMPFIRYDTGDIGAISEQSACKFNTPVLTRLDGRKLDLLYNTDGDLVSSLLVYKNMWKYTEIKQYQLIQKTPKKYVIKINVEDRLLRAEELIGEYKSYLGADADFSIEYVNDIPLLSSGKRRKVVNEYYK